MPNQLVRQATLQAEARSRRGVLERLFAKLFEGLVYAQIWEDPEVDLAALELLPSHRLVTIASGGCNVMSYLLADPAHLLAVDLNPTHAALLRLKLAAARHLPDYDTFRAFFARAGDRDNLAIYRRFLAPHLDPVTRAFWEGRDFRGRQRIGMFGRDLYRHGLLGRTIQMSHAVCRLHGLAPERLVEARTLAEQRAMFDREIAPVFASPMVRTLARWPAAYFGLGIPPAQFDALRIDARGDLVDLLRRRVERLACDFPIQENWFAWQAFAGRYGGVDSALPPYLRPASFPLLKERATRVDIALMTVTDLLRRLDAGSVDRFVLLDAQDWMTPAQLIELWAQIDRTARAEARVVFRTAAADSPLPGQIPDSLLAGWDYDAERSKALHDADRSAIYGGFHLYRRRP